MASDRISFEQIPASIRKPGKYFEFNTRLAVRTLPGNLQKVLFVAPRLASGTQPALAPVDVFSDDQAATLFGRGSLAHLMVRAGITANPYMQLTVVAVDDAAAGVAASGTVTIAGTATGAGSLTLSVAGVPVQIAIASGETAGAIAAKLAAQIGQQPDLPVTATAELAVLTLAAKNKGEHGNSIKLKAVSRAAGITAATTAMSGGQNDPDLTEALATIAAAGHQIIGHPFPTQASLAALRAHLEFVSGPLEHRPARGIAGFPGTLAAGTALAASNNSGRVSIGWHRNSSRLPAEIAAAYAAVVASEEDPARPLNTLELKGLDVTDLADRPTRTEQENALRNGLTPFEIGPGDKVQIVRAISTYTKNAEGVDDVALLDLTTIGTLDYASKAFRERVALRFPRDKKTARAKDRVRSELLDVAFKLEELEILENVEANKDGFIVEDDAQDPNRLNARIPVDVVNGLHVFAGRIDLLL